jgi:hypothetical protein
MIDSNFAYNSEVRTSTILEQICVIKMYGFEVIFNGITSLPNFIKMY